MKINLLLDNPKGILSGYANIDPIAPEGRNPNEDHRLKLDVTNFDEVCDDAEASEINVLNVLSYFPAKDQNNIFAYWLKKLRHGGILRIGDLDLLEVAKATFLGALTLEDANVLLYGEQDKPWKYRKCAMTVNQVAGALKGLGYKIIKKRVSHNEFYLEAQRP